MSVHWLDKEKMSTSNDVNGTTTEISKGIHTIGKRKHPRQRH